jgi:hypothetical protein
MADDAANVQQIRRDIQKGITEFALKAYLNGSRLAPASIREWEHAASANQW